MKNLPDELRKLREHLNLGQIEMAQLLGVSLAGYRFWERGANGAAPENLEKIRALLKKTYGDQHVD